MIIIKRNRCTYYVREESIILEYGRQFISYNVYSLQNRKRFKDFKATLLESQPYEYDNIQDLIGLSMRFGLKGTTGYRPTIQDTDTFIK